MSLTWILIRGSGIAAFVLLGASVIWGLMISSKAFGRAVKAKGLQWIHESFGLAAVLAVTVHMMALVADDFVEFTWADVLVPGLSDWEPLAVAFGVVAFWSILLVAGSFYVKRWIGQSTWRSIHFLSYGAFVAALAHGVLSGTDSAHPLMIGLYLTVFAVVVLLTAIRIAAAMNADAPQRRERTPAIE